MGTSAVDKKPYKNQTAGWLGVVKLDHLGAQVGFGVKPFGVVWLSEDEATLTARAPADPAHNPFVEQEFQFQNDRGEIVMAPMRPLVLIEDDREIPAEERFVPGVVTQDAAAAAAVADTQRALAGDADRPVPSEPVAASPAPPMTAAVPAEQGSLQGAAAPPQAPETDAVAQAPPPQAPAPASVASAPQNQGPVPSESAGTGDQAGSPSEDEHAAHLESGEETGAAEIPAGEAPEGEYASHEEVGSPDAPTQGAA